MFPVGPVVNSSDSARTETVSSHGDLPNTSAPGRPQPEPRTAERQAETAISTDLNWWGVWFEWMDTRVWERFRLSPGSPIE